MEVEFIFNIPYPIFQNISNMLDVNHKWRDLGGLMLYDTTTLELFGQAIFAGKSPSEKMLNDWANRNHSVLELFILLSRLQYYRAMQLLKPLVNPRYHHLLERATNPYIAENESSSYGSNDDSDDLPLPDFKPEGCKDFFTVQTTQMTPCEHNETFHLEHCRTDFQELNISPDSSPGAYYDVAMNKKPFDSLRNSIEESTLQIYDFDKNYFTNESEQYLSSSKCDYMSHKVKIDMEERGQSSLKAKQIPNKTAKEEKISLVFPHTSTIPYSEILQATNNFDSTNIIGQGSFGIVYKSNWRHTVVAIKKFITKIEDGKDNNKIKQTLTEIQSLPVYQHDNILPLYGCSIDGLEPCLIYMYMINGSLEDRLACKNNSKPLNWNLRYQIVIGTARAIQFLHTNKPSLIHGDIKSANILLDKSYEPKIGDFGLARVGETDLATHVSTKTAREITPYLPSEYLRNRQLSTKVDIYSLGVVLYEIATSLKAIVNNKQYLTDYIIDQEECDISMLSDTKAGKDISGLFSSFIEMGKRCTSKLKRDRPDMTEVLQYFEHLPILDNISGNVLSTLTNLNQVENDNPQSDNQLTVDNIYKNDNVQQTKEKDNHQVINWSENTYIINGESQSAFSCINQEDGDSQNIIEIPYMSAKFKSLPF